MTHNVLTGRLNGSHSLTRALVCVYKQYDNILIITLSTGVDIDECSQNNADFPFPIQGRCPKCRPIKIKFGRNLLFHGGLHGLGCTEYYSAEYRIPATVFGRSRAGAE